MHSNWKAGISMCFTIALLALSSSYANGQAALLMEEPYGLFGTINPTGHNAMYLENVCAETPLIAAPLSSRRIGRRDLPV